MDTKSKNSIVCSLNFAPHYRLEIYKLMEDELDCHFYFGDRTYQGIKKIKYENLKRPPKELRFVRLFGKFYYLIGGSRLKNGNYDTFIITAQPYDISSWILLLRNFILNKRTYIWNHGMYGGENYVQRKIKILQSHLATGYFLYGHRAKDIMSKYGIPKKKLHVIYNSLEHSKAIKLRKTLRNSMIYSNYFGNQNPNIIFIGRITKVKKLGLVIEAMKLLEETHDFHFNFIIVGAGEEQSVLEKMSNDMGLVKRIWFYGPCYDEEIISELIFNADITVSPGNIGLTAIHSFSYGTPCITHDSFKNQMPEFEAIQTEKTGLFFKQDDIMSLASSILQWIKKHPSKTNAIIENCYEVIDKKYNPHAQIELMKSVLYESPSD
jgi:glycosyltransferase involved in cell wall biosynthesis